MMQHNTLPICPRCHKEAQTADAAFCAFCGAPIIQPAQEIPQEVKAMLLKAEEMQDPVKKYALLSDLEKKYPDTLEVAEALLFHGRLHERSSRNIDFSVIKCYLWHIYLTPGEFTQEKFSQLRTELVAGPQLQKCLSLAADPDVFMRRYLERLGAQFVSMFMKGSNHYNGSIFGFRLDSRMGRVLAAPMANMMGNIRKDMELDDKQRDLLYDAIYRAFLTETGGEDRWVNEQLSKKGYPIPVKL